MSASQQLHGEADEAPLDVEIYPSTSRISYLTDRWGESHDPIPEQGWTWASLEITRAQVDEFSQGLDDVWGSEAAFLVHDKTDMQVKIYVEFEFSEDWQPSAPLGLDATSAEIAAWRKTLAFHGPAIHHVLQGLADIDDPTATRLRVLFDPAAFYNGAIAVLMPLDTLHLLDGVIKLLFQQNLTFPPSAHAQMGVAGGLRWRYDPAHIPQAALPGLHVPLDPL